MNNQMLMAYALNAQASNQYKAFSSEAFIKAAEVTLLGMGMVFAVLTILWVVLAIFKLLFAKDAKSVETEAPKVTEAPAPVVTEVAATDDGELIAVITAAIAAYRASEEGMDSAEAGGFRVVSFKRAGAGRAWNSNK